MARFLAGKELEEAVYDIIFNAKKRLLIISPFIKLDEYFRKLFDKHKGNAELTLVLAFGKNENNVNKSFNSEDFEYFKQFPNVSIVFVPNLHAKYYSNEKHGIITSINLYDYSFKNNIEFGIISESGLIRTEKIDSDAWNKSMEILTNNNVVFVRKPNFRKKIIGKDYIGSETLYDVTDKLVNGGKVPLKSIFDFEDSEMVNVPDIHSRISREEFEKSQEEIKPEEIKDDSISGFCIHCKKRIETNPKAPYCKDCYSVWKEHKDKNRKEKFCHICGKNHTSTLLRPACYSCYKVNKN